MWRQRCHRGPLVDELSFRHHEVMGLVVCTLDHDAYEPKCLECQPKIEMSPLPAK